MKRIIIAFCTGILFGLVMWLINWLNNGNGYITYTPVVVLGETVGYIDHLLDPLLFVLFAYVGSFVFSDDTRIVSDHVASRREFVSMCYFVPSVMCTLITCAVGWKIAFMISAVMFAFFTAVALLSLPVFYIAGIAKEFGES